MPNKIKKILIIGGGPVAIGQGCELDLLACQAIDTLRKKGFETVFVNSNPASIAADSDISDSVYIEPLTPDSLMKIIEVEKPDSLLPTFGGQTALNLTMQLARDGALEQMGLIVLGANPDAIAKTENKSIFAETMKRAGLPILSSAIAGSIEEGIRVVHETGFPAILKTAYTTGGAGSAVAYNVEEFVSMLSAALKSSPICQVMIEKAILGWKETELEVLRDANGQSEVVACAESVDPVGIHTGDSTVVIPPLTLAKDKIDELKSMAVKAIEAIGVVGAAGVRFAIHPCTGEIVLIGASVCVGPLTTLASHTIGTQLGRISAALAVGVGLDEALPKSALATPDFVAVKIPRFAFDRFPGADTTLNTCVKSVGEVVGIGCSFNEAVQKAIRSLEVGRFGLGADGKDEPCDSDLVRLHLVKPNPTRLFFVHRALADGMSVAEISELTKIDPVFIESIRELVEFEKEIEGKSLVSIPSEQLSKAKALGYSDAQLAFLLETEEEQVRIRRKVLGIEPKSMGIGDSMVYSTYGSVSEGLQSKADKKVIVLGGGPNRIGQSSEFDYCRAHALRAIAEEGCESIAVNANSAGVSTDPITPGKLYIDSQTVESVLGIIEREKPDGVIVQFMGRTLPQLSRLIAKAGVPIFGTSIESINRVKDKTLLAELAKKLNLLRTANDAALSIDDAPAKVDRVGYPILVRAARMVGGQTAEIIYDSADLKAFLESGIDVSSERPLLIDRFLEGAIEVGVDAISDGETTLICGVMEFIEQAGVHSGDSACSLPPYGLPNAIVEEIKQQTQRIAQELGIKGLLGVQFAIKADDIYLLEIHPRASRTLPFVSKATGIDWAGAATRVMLGKSLKDQGITSEIKMDHISVKETVFPFARFANVDVVLGPEMKSTGEVMGMNATFGAAYIKAQIAAGQNLPQGGTAFVSVASRDKSDAVEIGKKLHELGFEVAATAGTARALYEGGVEARVISKIGEGRPDAIDLIKNGEMDLIINTPSGKKPRMHEVTIRSAAVARGIPIVTTMAGAKATLFGMEAIRTHRASVRSLKEYK